jgi:hypothetical protein
LQDYALWLAEKYADRPSGLIETTADSAITSYYGIGNDECTGALWQSRVPDADFTRALLRFRQAVTPFNYGTFYPPGPQHTFLEDDVFFDTSVAGTRLVDWFARIADGEQAGHVGP